MKVFVPAIMVSGILLGAGVASAAPGDFGGRWAVRMVTEAGVCEGSYNDLIAVDDGGRVRYIPQDSDAPPSVSGSVGPSGAVNLDIRKSIARVSATGQLKGTSACAQAGGLPRSAAQPRQRVKRSKPTHWDLEKRAAL